MAMGAKAKGNAFAWDAYLPFAPICLHIISSIRQESTTQLHSYDIHDVGKSIRQIGERNTSNANPAGMYALAALAMVTCGE